MPRKPVPMYRTDYMTAISKTRARNFGGAARIYANRAARNLFGRSGQMFSVKRVMPVRREPRQYAEYRAVIGTKRGVRTELEFPITFG